MPGRIIHNLDGKTSFIPYGKKGQVETWHVDDTTYCTVQHDI
jgi:hypothetical protein